jgi:hypothetical protein
VEQADEKVEAAAPEEKPPPPAVAGVPPPAAPKSPPVQEFSFAGDWAEVADGAEVDLCLFALLNEVAEQADADVCARTQPSACATDICSQQLPRVLRRTAEAGARAQAAAKAKAAAQKAAFDLCGQVPMMDLPSECPRCCSQGGWPWGPFDFSAVRAPRAACGWQRSTHSSMCTSVSKPLKALTRTHGIDQRFCFSLEASG